MLRLFRYCRVSFLGLVYCFLLSACWVIACMVRFWHGIFYMLVFHLLRVRLRCILFSYPYNQNRQVHKMRRAFSIQTQALRSQVSLRKTSLAISKSR